MAFKRGLVLILMLILMMLVGAVGCTGENQDAKGATDGSDRPVVVKIEGGDYGLLQPYTASSRGPGKYRANLIFEKLIDKDENGIIPWLGEEWKIEEGGKKIVFDLRKDVQWQDGEPFTAGDVVFTFDYIKQYHPVGAADMMLDNDFVKVNLINDHQVEFILSEYKANFIEELYTISILPQHIWSGVDKPDQFTSEGALTGTGPYRLTDYKKEHGSYRLEANKDFWGPEPAVDVLEFVPVSDPVLALENGDIDIADIPVDILERFKSDPSYTVMEKPGIVWAYRLRFNMENVPDFQNKELRQAFAYAIDRQELVDKVGRGAGVPGSLGILPAGHAWAEADLPRYERDAAAGKKLLQEAGMNDKELVYELIVGEDKEVRIGELIREQLKEIGVDINITALDTKTRDNRIAKGEYQLALLGHGAWAKDPDYLRVRFSPAKGDWSNGTPGYVNEELQELLIAQCKETDEKSRRKMISAIQKILAEDVPEIPLYFTTDYLVYNNEKYDGWMHIFDHHEPTHNKLSFLKR